MAAEGGGGIEVLPEPETKGRNAAASTPENPNKKRKTFHPLKSLKRWFSGRKRSKSKSDDMYKAKSVDKLQPEASADEDRVHRSQSENSVFQPSTQPHYQHQANPGLSRELHGRLGHHGYDEDEDEGMPRSPPPHTTTVDALIENGMKEKSMSLDSDHSLLSVDSSENELDDDFFHEKWSVGVSPQKSSSVVVGKMDLDAVHSTSNLNLSHQKHKLEVRQKAKRPSGHPNRRRTASPNPVLPLVAEETTKGPITEERPTSEEEKSFDEKQSPDDSLDSRKLPDLSADEDEHVGGLDLSTDEGVDEGDEDIETETAIESTETPKVETIPKSPSENKETIMIEKPLQNNNPDVDLSESKEPQIKEIEKVIQRTPSIEDKENSDKVTTSGLILRNTKSFSKDSSKTEPIRPDVGVMKVGMTKEKDQSPTKPIVIKAAAEVHQETSDKRTSVEVVVVGGKDISDIKGVISKDVAMGEIKHDTPASILRRDPTSTRDTSKRQTIAVTSTNTKTTIFGDQKKRSSFADSGGTPNWEDLKSNSTNTTDIKASDGQESAGGGQGSEFAAAFQKFQRGASKRKSDIEQQASSLPGRQKNGMSSGEEKENTVQSPTKSSVQFVGGPTIPNVRSPLSTTAPASSDALKDTSSDKNITKAPEKKDKPPILASKPSRITSPTTGKHVASGQSRFARDVLKSSSSSEPEKRNSLILEKTPKKPAFEPKTVVIETHSSKSTSGEKNSLKEKLSDSDGASSYQRKSPLLRDRDRSRTAPVVESDSPRVSVQRASSTASSSSGHRVDVSNVTKSTSNISKAVPVKKETSPVSPVKPDKAPIVLKSSVLKPELRKLNSGDKSDGQPSWMNMAKRKTQGWEETKEEDNKTNTDVKKESKTETDKNEDKTRSLTTRL